MNIEIVKDIQTFYKTIGALDELSERGFVKPNDLNNEDHDEYLKKLIKKYNIEYTESNDFEDNIFGMEGAINERFTSIMEGL